MIQVLTVSSENGFSRIMIHGYSAGAYSKDEYLTILPIEFVSKEEAMKAASQLREVIKGWKEPKELYVS